MRLPRASSLPAASELPDVIPDALVDVVLTFNDLALGRYRVEGIGSGDDVAELREELVLVRGMRVVESRCQGVNCRHLLFRQAAESGSRDVSRVLVFEDSAAHQNEPLHQ